MTKNGSAFLVSMIAALFAAGCGKGEEPSPASSKPPRPVAGRVSFDRASPHCFLNVQLEADAGVTRELMKRLAGTWKHHMSKASIFFDNGKSEIVFREYFGWYDTKEFINYRKLCISAPLSAVSSPDLEGYRILEAMASNNEGGVAFAFKLDEQAADGSYGKLLMSDYAYRRFAAESKLVELDTFVASVRYVSTYGERRD